MLGLYIHIPFCKNICYYCDFPKLINQRPETIKIYLDKLISDINKLKDQTFDSLYIGGGTPNYLDDCDLERLLSEISKLHFTETAEKTIECNFELITKKQVKLFKKYGINRLSIGVQTFNQDIGKSLNRISDYEVLKQKVILLNQYGLNNYNFDLIYALPNQTLDIVKDDLEKAMSLSPKHISYYSLIYEDKCVLHHLKYPKADEELELAMFDYIKEYLLSYGFKRYEISNFALEGYESKHNLLYWSMDEYIGLGLGASSLYNNIRITNSLKMKDYLNDLNIMKDEVEKEEYFIVGLRKNEGVSLSYFKDKYQIDPIKEYGLQRYIDSGLLIIDGEYLKFSEKGFDLSNQVLVNFV